jgi:Ca2+-binding EF-hand superfamily protein
MVTSKVESPSTNSPKVEKRADKLSEQDRQNARQMFDKYDKDKSGNISKDELRSLLEEYLRTKKMGNMVFERYVHITKHVTVADWLTDICNKQTRMDLVMLILRSF